MRLMIWVVLRLGRRVGRVLLHPIVVYFLIFSPGARKASSRFLSRALERPPRLADLYRHFHAFASTILDRVYFLSGRHRAFDLRTFGTAEVDAIVRRGKGCVLIGSHLGSFEAVRASAMQAPRSDVAMIMDDANAQKIGRVLAELNPAAADTIIRAGRPGTALRAREVVDAGGLVGVLADRLRPGDTPVAATCLGASLAFPAGPFQLAAALRAPVVLCFGLYRGGNRYDVHFEVLQDPLILPRERREQALAAIVAAYASRLEHYARIAPYNWFNFYDVWSPPS